MLTREAVLEIVGSLNRDGVRFLMVGGLAVIAHGYVRATMDLDLVVDLEAENARRAICCLSRLGYQSRVPVPLEDFADPTCRADWIANKDLVVFSLWKNSTIGPIVIDLFVIEPFPFADAWRDAMWQEHANGTRFPYVDLTRLLAMKRLAGRPKDLLDVAELTRIAGGNS